MTVPTGIASAAAIRAATGANRMPMPATAVAPMTRAKTRNVRWVPRKGIRTSEETIVPVSEPAVEIAYSRPEILPACSTSGTARRSAYGEAAPSSITGTATRTRTASSEPANAPAEIESRASTETSKKGRARNGTIASSTAAARTILQSARSDGSRSARRPPNQYPIESATRTTPIVFAQTIVEAPKNGAISRATAISAPSDPVPTTKTSR